MSRAEDQELSRERVIVGKIDMKKERKIRQLKAYRFVRHTNNILDHTKEYITTNSTSITRFNLVFAKLLILLRTPWPVATPTVATPRDTYPGGK